MGDSVIEQKGPVVSMKSAINPSAKAFHHRFPIF